MRDGTDCGGVWSDPCEGTAMRLVGCAGGLIPRAVTRTRTLANVSSGLGLGRWLGWELEVITLRGRLIEISIISIIGQMLRAETAWVFWASLPSEHRSARSRQRSPSEDIYARWQYIQPSAHPRSMLRMLSQLNIQRLLLRNHPRESHHHHRASPGFRRGSTADPLRDLGPSI